MKKSDFTPEMLLENIDGNDVFQVEHKETNDRTAVLELTLWWSTEAYRNTLIEKNGKNNEFSFGSGQNVLHGNV